MAPVPIPLEPFLLFDEYDIWRLKIRSVMILDLPVGCPAIPTSAALKDLVCQGSLWVARTGACRLELHTNIHVKSDGRHVLAAVLERAASVFGHLALWSQLGVRLARDTDVDLPSNVAVFRLHHPSLHSSLLPPAGPQVAGFERLICFLDFERNSDEEFHRISRASMPASRKKKEELARKVPALVCQSKEQDDELGVLERLLGKSSLERLVEVGTVALVTGQRKSSKGIKLARQGMPIPLTTLVPAVFHMDYLAICKRSMDATFASIESNASTKHGVPNKSSVAREVPESTSQHEQYIMESSTSHDGRVSGVLGADSWSDWDDRLSDTSQTWQEPPQDEVDYSSGHAEHAFPDLPDTYLPTTTELEHRDVQWSDWDKNSSSFECGDTFHSSSEVHGPTQRSQPCPNERFGEFDRARSPMSEDSWDEDGKWEDDPASRSAQGFIQHSGGRLVISDQPWLDELKHDTDDRPVAYRMPPLPSITGGLHGLGEWTGQPACEDEDEDMWDAWDMNDQSEFEW
ncbi:hypothetical protein BN1723_016399 [Verticillium longisporum]|uniref:Uncharacterized protein n=2 Tax=Verticillium longisporum TaxID=100787 RepID=A0A0G4NEI7_VERLO|nr:hypothetical protein BN1723_016399 [Verticillium longisporum]